MTLRVRGKQCDRCPKQPFDRFLKIVGAGVLSIDTYCREHSPGPAGCDRRIRVLCDRCLLPAKVLVGGVHFCKKHMEA